MAEIKVDASKAVQNLKELNSQLDRTEKNIEDVNSSSVDMGQAFATMTHNTDDMTKGMDAANAILSNMGVNMGGVGKAMAAVKGIVPALNTGLKGTEGGFKGVAKAIAATGIGALVVAVGLLASNWEKVTHWVKAFRTNIQDTMPGLARMIDFVGNAVNSIKDFFQQVADKIGNSRVGKWLGLDKIGEKVRNIKVAVKAANEETRAWADATEQSSDKMAKSLDKVDDSLKRVLVDWDKVDAASKKRREDAKKRRGEDFSVAAINPDDFADTLNMELDSMSDFATERINLDNAVAQNWIENEEKKQKASQNTTSVVSALSATLSAMMAGLDSDSRAYKALATIQIVANTLSGAMAVFSAPDNVTMAQKLASYATVIATGAGSIVSLNSGKLTSVSAPQLSTGLPTAQTAINTANTASNVADSQVYITEKQLSENSAKQVKIKQKTTF